MRCFTGLTLDASVVSRAAETLERLRALAPRARWVPPEKLHVTLSYLGEMAPERLAGVEAALSRVAEARAPFRLTVEGAGTFGRPARPQVLWAGLGGELDALHALERQVAQALAALGFVPDARPYTGHVTLARAREPGGDAALAACRDTLLQERWGESHIHRIQLFESKRGAYETLVELALRG